MLVYLMRGLCLALVKAVISFLTFQGRPRKDTLHNLYPQHRVPFTYSIEKEEEKKQGGTS